MTFLALVILKFLSPKDFTGLPRIQISHFRFKSGENISITHSLTYLTYLSDLVDCYNLTLSNILNKHASLNQNCFVLSLETPWFTPALQQLKSSQAT